MAAAAVVAIAGLPGQALAEGPGYGGTADQLGVVWWTADDAAGTAAEATAATAEPAQTDAIVVSGVGFLAGSEVILRIGDQTEFAAVVDATGAVRTVVDLQAVDTTVDSGTSVLAVGTTPSGTTLTLVGFVPPRSTIPGRQSLTGQLAILGLLLAALFGGLIPPVRGGVLAAGRRLLHATRPRRPRPGGAHRASPRAA